MSFAIFKGETNLKDLVSRLFGISGEGSQAKADQAAKALLDANPQLKDISKVPAGSIVKVPATAPPLKPSEQAAALPTNRIAITAQAHHALDAISQKLAEMEARASDRASVFAAQAQSEQVQWLLQTAPRLKETLPNLISDTLSLVSAAKANQASRVEALSGIKSSVQLLAQSKA